MITSIKTRLFVMCGLTLLLAVGCADENGAAAPSAASSVMPQQSASQAQAEISTTPPPTPSPSDIADWEEEEGVEPVFSASPAPAAPAVPFDPPSETEEPPGREQVGLEEYLEFQAEIKKEYPVPDYQPWQNQIFDFRNNLRKALDPETYADISSISIPYHGSGDYAGFGCAIGFTIYYTNEAQVKQVVNQQLKLYDESLGPIKIEWVKAERSHKTLSAARDDILAQKFRQPIKMIGIDGDKLFINAYMDSADLEAFLNEKGYMPFVLLHQSNGIPQGKVT